MSAILVRPTHKNDPDVLTGNELASVKINGEGGTVARLDAPDGGWTLDMLESLESVLNSVYGYWDVYLGDFWIGSSEA